MLKAITTSASFPRTMSSSRDNFVLWLSLEDFSIHVPFVWKVSLHISLTLHKQLLIGHVNDQWVGMHDNL